MSGVFLEGYDQYIYKGSISYLNIDFYTSDDITTTQYIYSNLSNDNRSGSQVYIYNGELKFLKKYAYWNYTYRKYYYSTWVKSFDIQPNTYYHIEFSGIGSSYNPLNIKINEDSYSYTIRIYYGSLKGNPFDQSNAYLGQYKGESNFFHGQLMKIDGVDITNQNTTVSGTRYYWIDKYFISSTSPKYNQTSQDYNTLDISWNTFILDSSLIPKYNFYISDIPDFSNVLYEESDLVDDNIRITDNIILVPNRTYFWKLEVLDQDSTLLGTHIYEFSTKSLNLTVDPVNGKTDVRFYETFSWDTDYVDKQNLTYNIYLRREIDTDYETILSNTPNTSFNFVSSFGRILDFNTQYKWKIQVIYQDVVIHEQEFTFKTFDLNYISFKPTGTNVEQYPTLTWELNDENPSYNYNVYFGKDPDNLFELQKGITDKSLPLSDFEKILKIEQSTKYYWKLVVKYDNYFLKEWLINYTTKTPSITYLYPQWGQTDVEENVILKWDLDYQGNYYFDIYFRKYGEVLNRVLVNYPYKEVQINKITKGKLLDSDTRYDWKIVVKQQMNGQLTTVYSSPIYNFTVRKYRYHTIRFKRGTGTPPNQELGEPLFSIDQGKLYIGMGVDIPPIEIISDNFYNSDTPPVDYDENTLWLDTSTIPYRLKIYRNNKWVELIDFNEIGNMRELMTITKRSLVDQINEIYRKTSFEIVNFNYSLEDNGMKIELVWKNPYHDYFTTRELYVSTSDDILTMDRDTCYQTKQLLTDGIGNGSGQIDSYSFSTQLGQTYYFKIFQGINIDGNIEYSDGQTLMVEQKDVVPPKPVSDIKIQQFDKSILMTWKSPDNEDYKGCIVVRNEDHFPTSSNDGKVVQNLVSKGNLSYFDKGLTNGKIYYYQIFPYDTNLNFNYDSSQFFHQIPEQISIPEVTQLTQNIINNGQTLQINWYNPLSEQEKIYLSREVFYSLDDLTNYTYSDCVNRSDVMIQSYGIGTGEGQLDEQLINITDDLEQQTVYIKQFTKFLYNNQEYQSIGTTISIFVKDYTPPDRQSIIIDNVEDRLTTQKITMTVDEPDDEDYYKTIVVKQKSLYSLPLQNIKTESDLIHEINLQGGLVKIVDTVFKSSENKTLTDTVNMGSTYYYKQFQIDYQGNVNVDGTEINVTPQISDYQVSDFTQTPKEYGIELTWTDPDETQFPNWGGTLIVRNLTVPQSPTDGEVVVISNTRNQYQTTPFVDNPPNKRITYYYRQFTFDTSGNYYTNVYRVDSGYILSVPPSPTTLNEQIIQDKYVLLKWSDPTSQDWSQTVVMRYNTVVGIEKGLKNQYQDTYFKDDNLQPEQSYLYKIYPYDIYGNYNNSIEIQISTKNNIPSVDQLVYDVIKDDNSDITSINLKFYITDSSVLNSLPFTTQIEYIIFYQNKDISNYTYFDCIYDNDILVLQDRTSQNKGEYINSYYGIQYNQEYYIKIFSLYKSTYGENIYFIDKGKDIYIDLRDKTPPSPLNSFTFSQYNDKVEFSWINPDDYDYDGVKIVRNTTHIPQSVDDGELIQTLDKTQTNYTDNTTSPNTLYFYSFFTFDSHGVINLTPTNTQVVYTSNYKYVVLRKDTDDILTDVVVELKIDTEDDITLYSFYDISLTPLNYHILDLNNKIINVKIPNFNEKYYVILYSQDKSTPSLGNPDTIYLYYDDFNTSEDTKITVSSNIQYNMDIQNSQLIITDLIDKSTDTFVYDTSDTSNYIELNYTPQQDIDYEIRCRLKINQVDYQEMVYQGLVLLRSDDTVLQSNQIYDVSPLDIKINDGGSLLFIDSITNDSLGNSINNDTFVVLKYVVSNREGYIDQVISSNDYLRNNTTQITQLNRIQLQIGSRKETPISNVIIDSIFIKKIDNRIQIEFFYN